MKKHRGMRGGKIDGRRKEVVPTEAVRHTLTTTTPPPLSLVRFGSEEVPVGGSLGQRCKIDSVGNRFFMYILVKIV